MRPERECLGEADFEYTGRWYGLDVIWEYCEWETWEDHFVVLRHKWDFRRCLLYRCPLETWWSWDWDKREVAVMSFVRKAEHAEVPPEKRAEAMDVEWQMRYPALWEHLTRGSYDGGTRRVLSSLSWFLGLEALTVCLQDRDNKRSLFASGTTWDEALGILEQLASQGEKAPWRADKRETGASSRLVKK